MGDQMDDQRIVYEGDQAKEAEAVKLVDKALKEHGDLGTYGDLSVGLDKITTEMDMVVKISDKGTYYFVDIAPVSGHAEHDFSFSVDKKSGKLSDVAVGEIEPDPKR